MINIPDPPDHESNTNDDAIKIGIVSLPKDQLFPVVLILVLLTSGVAVVLAATDAFRLGGLIAIIVGLGWAALIYQNTQNRRIADQHESIRDATREFDITITVLSPDGQPVRGAAVTALGPVNFTNRKTNRDGRVVYKYTGQDQINYRNKPVRFSASFDNMKAQGTRELTAQTGQFVELRLETADPSPPLKSTPPTGKPIDHDQGINTMSLDDTGYREIVDFIEPFVSDVRSRNALISRTFYNEPILNDIDTAGAASTFASHLITVLNNYDGGHAIVRLLETLKEDVGPNRQQEIDALISKLQT